MNDNTPTTQADWQNLHAACAIMEGFHNFIRVRCDSPVATVAIDNLPDGWLIGIQTEDGRGFSGRGSSVFDACQDIELVWTDEREGGSNG